MSQHFTAIQVAKAKRKLDRIFARPDREEPRTDECSSDPEDDSDNLSAGETGSDDTDNAHDDSERADSGEGDGDQGGEEIETEVQAGVQEEGKAKARVTKEKDPRVAQELDRFYDTLQEMYNEFRAVKIAMITSTKRTDRSLEKQLSFVEPKLLYERRPEEYPDYTQFNSDLILMRKAALQRLRWLSGWSS
ncbi:hypothetical protein Q5P01_000060 [Channa striata]|uniref:Uncharacterized protein n=1 Tax=Channa striata TaxID=64152 RepID=A0AA88ILE0_CHASR|nr:hypothetical protein Q5P01_000060 [Channa striata]